VDGGAGSAGAGGAPSGGGDDGGCGCRTAGGRGARHAEAAFGMLLLAFALRRRRSRDAARRAA
jgi:MYXO-CTERM domain-containing protein